LPGLAGIGCREDALVSDGEGAGRAEGRQTQQAAPAALPQLAQGEQA